MRPGRFIVCERTGAWALALRRHWAAEQETFGAIRQTRTANELFQALEAGPQSVAALEMTPQRLDDALEMLDALSLRYPLTRVAVVGPREVAAYEWLAHELGAVLFVTSPRRLGPLAALARRRLGDGRIAATRF